MRELRPETNEHQIFTICQVIYITAVNITKRITVNTNALVGKRKEWLIKPSENRVVADGARSSDIDFIYLA